MNDHQLVHQLCQKAGLLTDFPVHRLDELVKLCQLFSAHKIADAARDVKAWYNPSR